MSIRTEQDNQQIDNQQEKMHSWLKQENITLMATEDRKNIPNNEQNTDDGRSRS